MPIQHRKNDYLERMIAEAFAALKRLMSVGGKGDLPEYETQLNYLLSEVKLDFKTFEEMPLEQLQQFLAISDASDQLLELVADSLKYKATATGNPELETRANWLYQHILQHPKSNSISYSLLLKKDQLPPQQ
ncbi:hypothetical protein [Chitinophaga sp. Cy-1792]|uniref:hypothetical protein n=1 Tax=Chitinophaga sp. Cy-1792 TaxID=2608339 RepID=UPI00141F4534|nr:hypothetical protein [Chitinophaga sp. Cy-1792]NIG55139.1 hypothetical protein [Chitinophaga sp. Cy-1792]